MNAEYILTGYFTIYYDENFEIYLFDYAKVNLKIDFLDILKIFENEGLDIYKYSKEEWKQGIHFDKVNIKIPLHKENVNSIKHLSSTEKKTNKKTDITIEIKPFVKTKKKTT